MVESLHPQPLYAADDAVHREDQYEKTGGDRCGKADGENIEAGRGARDHADDDEDIETRACTLAEARAMVARGEIEDLKTAFGLTLV